MPPHLKALRTAGSFFVLVFSFYFAQGLFFVTVASYLSTLADGVQAIGNLLLLAVIPFLLAGIYLTPMIDRISTRRQVVSLKSIRAFVLLSLGFAIATGGDKKISIYFAVIFFDLAFYIFQSTSAKLSKEISAPGQVLSVESLALLAVQFGMITGSLFYSQFVNALSFENFFYVACGMELLGLMALSFYLPPIAQLPLLKVNSQGGGFRQSLKRLHARPGGLWLCLAFALILPLYLVFNLVIGPWAQQTFADSGRSLGLISALSSGGACVTSLLLIRLESLRNSRLLHFSPLVFGLACASLFFLKDSTSVLGVAFVIGSSLAGARVSIRSALIQSVDQGQLNEISLLGTLIGALCSAVLVTGVSRIPIDAIFLGFSVVLAGSVFQFIAFLCGHRQTHQIQDRKSGSVA